MPAVGLVDWRRREDFAPLILVVNGPGRHKLVGSLGEVADALINAWPADNGEVKTCLDAIRGNIQPKEARAALIRAAAEAGICVIAVVH
ncbi:hypothetical protein B5K05_13230 [Rhizobium phaseoli]|uniref:DUF982 domain-containing protein n=1 Tax=Rhizobium phaseoli TaxID=396 RepID=UPI000E0DA7A6|nr:DUF982 domain-containing protein [Rhizobium phaseoli]RDJ10092.1 hypothetical protein B5K04_13205 [Rhizobium phaseoli]RDJ14092.1 hypothetical protein B5K05_13230 [Rhizobium phaseoli]